MQPNIGTSPDGIAEETPSQLDCCQPQIPILAELLCSEPTDGELLNSTGEQVHNQHINNVGVGDEPFVESYFDPAILHHPDVINRLKILESHMDKPRDYLRNTTKDEILPYMRKIVASWMLEVCEEQHCGEMVFPLAVAILDKFLGTCSIKKEQLQLVACVCLLLSSKSRQCNHFSLDLLSWYTDNSVSLQSLRSWELMILSHLHWDINIITATDFVDFILVRCPGFRNQTTKECQLVRRHAITFIALCSTEPRFVGLKPSLVAASAIHTALKGIRMDSQGTASTLAHMTSVTVDQLFSVSSSIEHVISTEMAAIDQQSIDSPMVKNPSVGITTSTPSSSSTSSTATSSKLPCSHSAYGQNTPTDVQDIIV